MIILGLPSSEGTSLCLWALCQSAESAGRVLCALLCSEWVPVSAARKLEEGSIRDIKTDVTLAPGPVSMQGLTLKQKKWYQWIESSVPQATLKWLNIRELRLWDCEVTWLKRLHQAGDLWVCWWQEWCEEHLWVEVSIDLNVYLTAWIVAKLWLTIKEGRPALLSER